MPTQRSHDIHNLRGKWVLVWLEGDVVDLAPGVTLHIGVGGNEGIGGQSAVNAYGGSLVMERLGHGEFRASDVFSTLMAGPPERMELESRYFKILESSRTWRIEQGKLILANDEGDLARFKREPG